MGKGLEETLLKEIYKWSVINKHMKRYSTSLIIRKLQMT